MAARVETMAWSNEVPWHGLGFKIGAAERSDPRAMMKAAGCNWKVAKRAIFTMDKAGKRMAIPNEFALVRDLDDAVLSMVGSLYKPVQNEQAFDFFAKFCKAGHMTMETAGSLWGGRYVWVLARLQQDFAIGKTDELRPYVLLMSPHAHGKSLIMQYTAVRVVCWNTMQMALGDNLRGEKTAFRLPHSQNFEAKTDEAEKVLKLATINTKALKEASTHLSRTKAASAMVEKYFLEVLGVETDKSGAFEGKTPVMLPKFRAALECAPGAMEKSAADTWWGALNAVTYVIDHMTGNDRETGLKNAWIGKNSVTKQTALLKALEYAK